MDAIQNKFLTEKNCLLACLLGIVIYMLPYFILGGDATLRIHDNLNSNYVWYKILLESGGLWQDNSYMIQQIANGVPRVVFPSEFDPVVGYYYLFGPYGAYVFNRFLQTVAGFAGMLFLLRRHVVPGEENRVIQYGVALCFGLLPFWPFGSLSVAGLPFALYAFMNIRDREYTWHNWLIVIVFAVFSHLVLSGFFLLLVMSLLWVVDVFRKRANVAFLVALALVSLIYVFTNYRLFLMVFFERLFVSQRVEFQTAEIGLKESLFLFRKAFFLEQSHARTMHKIFILPATFIFGLWMAWKSEKRARNIFLVGLIFILVAAFLRGFWGEDTCWAPLCGARALLSSAFPMNLSRFYTLLPLAWLVLFAVVLFFMFRKSRNMRMLAAVLLVAQLAYQFAYHEIYVNRDDPSVSQFYASKQFSEIEKYLDDEKDSYRVVSVGIHPAVAQFNGFYTLDGYLPFYPLEYKHKFRQIIAGELDRNWKLKEMYDGWGACFYLFSSELKERSKDYLNNRAGNNFVIGKLDVDYQVLREMGGRYIFSAVRIDEDLNPAVKLRKVFKSDGSSAWDIYLYEVQPRNA